jgi:hypothetical protein
MTAMASMTAPIRSNYPVSLFSSIIIMMMCQPYDNLKKFIQPAIIRNDCCSLLMAITHAEMMIVYIALWEVGSASGTKTTRRACRSRLSKNPRSRR